MIYVGDTVYVRTTERHMTWSGPVEGLATVVALHPTPIVHFHDKREGLNTRCRWDQMEEQK